MRNFGRHNALPRGILMARQEIVIALDDDLQHRPEEIPKLLAALASEADVYGFPAARRHGLSRNLAAGRSGWPSEERSGRPAGA